MSTGDRDHERHGPLFVCVLLWTISVAGSAAADPLVGQELSFQGGFSRSWGEREAVICTLTCGPGSVHSHADLYAPMAGVVATVETVGPFLFETGAILTRKGWSVTAPTLRAWYLEVPALLQLRHRLASGGFGFSIAAGAALDLAPLEIRQTRPAAMVAGQISAGSSDGALWSLGMRFSRALAANYDLFVNALTFFVSITPRGVGEGG
jgi:hypothetical protein